jgi:hypothetical protein
MATQPGAINGGLFQRPPEAPNPTLYVHVESVDAAITKIRLRVGRSSRPTHRFPAWVPTLV